MTNLPRHPDELWTSYFVRRLRAEGFSPTEQDFEETEQVRTYDEGALDLLVTIDTREGLIEIHRGLVGLEESLRENSTYPQLQRDLFEKWLDESVAIIPRENPRRNLYLTFKEDGTVTVSSELITELHPTLNKYLPGTSWRAEEVIDDLIQYIQAIGYQEELSEELELGPQENSQRRGAKPSSSATLGVLSEGEYLSRLYVQAINRDANNQRFLEYRDKHIFYVLVDSSEIVGNVGKPFHNLYFVAQDLAPEDWQQKIVAFHESQCLHFGHEAAKGQEPRLARILGKEQEYLQWREQVDNGKLGCQGREEE